MSGRRIAVIGGGVSGITAGYLLSRTDHVTLFEDADRLGGHADTHLVLPAAGPPIGVDTGFIVYNERTYQPRAASTSAADGRYRMNLPEPDARLALSVRLDRPDGTSFAASVRGRAVPAGDSAACSSASGGGPVTSTSIHRAIDADRSPDVAGGPGTPVMRIRRPRESFRRIGASGLIGFGESYMAGERDSNDLTALLTVFAGHAAGLVPSWLQPFRRLAGAATLAEAQRRKIDRLLDRAGVGWIQKYIFPGGLLPSVTAIQDSLARTRLRLTGREDFGAHYAETLTLARG